MLRFRRKTSERPVSAGRDAHVSRLASQVFFGGFSVTSRMTSYARAFYERRYRQPKRLSFGRFVFIFDVALVSIIGLLLGLVLYATFRSFAPSITVTFESASFGVAAPTPIVAIVRAPNDSAVHRNVRAYWKLPAGMEIVESSPKLFSDRGTYLGTLTHGQEVRLHLIVRTYRPFGERVPIGIQIQEGGFFDAREGYFSFEKSVDGNGLTAEIPAEVLADHVVPDGAVLPILIHNRTKDTIPSVEIRPTNTSSIAFDRRSIGDLQPDEKRIIYLPLERLDKDPSVSWALVASSYEIASSTWSAKLIEWPNAPDIKMDSTLRQRSTAHIGIQQIGDASIVVLNPTASPVVQEWKEKDLASIDFGIGRVASPDRVVVIPVGSLVDTSSKILGPASQSLILGPLSLQTSIRYSSAAGDQIGAGPNPPEVGYETRYWVFFTVNQDRGSLKDIHIRATLPSGVKFTGATAVPDGGSWSVQNRVLDWKLSETPSEQPSVMIGAEISISPSVRDSVPYSLISSVEGQAKDGESGIDIEAEQGILTTEVVDR